MKEEFSMQITQIYAKKYKGSKKGEKGDILTEYCQIAMVSRNLASKRFQQTIRNIYPVALKLKNKVVKKRGPKTKYKSEHKLLIQKVWELYETICAERLHPDIVTGLYQLKKAGELLTFETNTINLCKIVSLGKLKQIIHEFPKPKGYRKHNRKPGIYSQVPIEVNFNKYASTPGYVEVDPVEHNGGNSGGKYGITGCYVDLFSQWVARSAALGQSQESIEIIHELNIIKFVHPIIKFHCDNARAVLKVLFKKVTGNTVTTADNKELALSRSRPYKKEDNGHVEQKNGDKIRKLVGYHRYDNPEQIILLNKLYQVEDLISNYFIPSQKLISKTYDQQGRPISKKYDKATTPYKRLFRSKQVDKATKKKLKSIYSVLSLVELRREAERIKTELFNSVSRKINKNESGT